jgi:hypothetical protein
MANSSQVVTVTFNATVTVFVTSASCTLSRTPIEIAAFGTDFVANVPGQARVSGTIEVLFDKSDHATLSANIGAAGAAASMVLLWNTAENWSGSAIITEFTVNASTEDIVRATINFVGTGTWTV